ncbi:nickel-responsive transcriptional regulator NikR [Candidatus Woesearchaeota archaeon]|nr:nickel-responsive transcriptional regulator NikR [Candidatus Woesearchaeota archaeon]
MDRVTRTGISFEPKLLKLFDRFIREKGYTNRSEAINDIIRERLFHRRHEQAIGTIKVTYDQRIGHYGKNVSNLQHDYHCQIISSMHTYLDHHTCLELIVVKGKADRVNKLLEKIKKTEGVKKAELDLEKQKNFRV